MSTILSFVLFLGFWSSNDGDAVRVLDHNGAQVKTTFSVEQKFIGTYKGSKKGFLILDADGTGTYRYDYDGLSPEGCDGTEIKFKWGFILEEDGKVVKIERPYGYSYPIVYNTTGEGGFQGCKSKSMIDYLLEYNDGTITVSSSDDWEKIK